MKRMPWIERRFSFDLPVSVLPNVIERLRGTPERIDERLRGLARECLTHRIDGSWSIQENIGHLIDVELLWHGRLDDFDAGLATLRPADMTNQRTVQAEYNVRPITEILDQFRVSRMRLVERLEGLDEAAAGRSAMHPRLARPMRVIDMTVFAAEHDDHHLARVTELLRVLIPNRSA